MLWPESEHLPRILCLRRICLNNNWAVTVASKLYIYHLFYYLQKNVTFQYCQKSKIVWTWSIWLFDSWVDLYNVSFLLRMNVSRIISNVYLLIYYSNSFYYKTKLKMSTELAFLFFLKLQNGMWFPKSVFFYYFYPLLNLFI